VDAIARIEEFTFGMDFEAFRLNPMLIAAIERKLPIISEAATRMGTEVEQQIPNQPWRAIGEMGNHLRHAYEGVDLGIIWNCVTDDLPPLKSAISEFIERSGIKTG